jgi:hypothetical protein
MDRGRASSARTWPRSGTGVLGSEPGEFPSIFLPLCTWSLSNKFLEAYVCEVVRCEQVVRCKYVLKVS